MIPRFNTHRYYLSGKNKISIFQPCHDLQRSIFRCICRLLLVFFVCFIISYTFCCHFESGGGMVVRWQRRNAVPEPAALTLRNQVRIFCVINTFQPRHESVAVHVKRTWAQRCNHYLFVSDDAHHELEPKVFYKVNDKWARMRATLEYLYQYHFNDGDWFLRANDDNFVIVENLRYMLRHSQANESIYYGLKLRKSDSDTDDAYMHSGAPIVFSKEALRRFVVEAMPNPALCRVEDSYEDNIELAKCLKNVGVVTGESLDEAGHHRILPFEAEIHLSKGMREDRHKWFLEQSFHTVTNFTIPVSKRAISFKLEYMPNIYNLYYYVYKVKIFGTMRKNVTLNVQL